MNPSTDIYYIYYSFFTVSENAELVFFWKNKNRPGFKQMGGYNDIITIDIISMIIKCSGWNGTLHLWVYDITKDINHTIMNVPNFYLDQYDMFLYITEVYDLL